MALYPLLMAPGFLSGAETPWGGTMLRDIFMKETPDESTGASLEVSTLSDHESMVAAGPQAGHTLGRMIELWGEDLTGVSGPFPLELCLLDAGSDQPAQVCPQNKAWVILNAEPGAMAAGFAVRPGNVYFIPAGTSHALGAGIQAYEVKGSLGKEAADARPVQNEGTTVLCKGGSRTYYVSDGGFELCRLNLSGRMPLEAGRMLLLTALAPCALCWGDGERMDFTPFTTVVVPAALVGAALEGDAKVLMAAVSNREKLRAELGYRAENVAGLMD